jgi:hypothetical protein
MLQIVFLVSLESSLRRRGAWAWFHDVWTCGAKVLEYWMISSLKIKLNRSWKSRRDWNVPLVLLERSWWAGFNGIYLVRFGFRMWEILIFKWFLLLKIQTNSQKTRFWKEKSVEDVVNLGPTAQATLVKYAINIFKYILNVNKNVLSIFHYFITYQKEKKNLSHVFHQIYVQRVVLHFLKKI